MKVVAIKRMKKYPTLWHSIGGCFYLGWIGEMANNNEAFGVAGKALLIWYSLGQIPVNESVVQKQYPNLEIPQLKRVLTNEQISQLSESYNRSLYDSINK